MGLQVKVRLGEPGGKNPRSHYILSRYLISRMLTLTRIPHAKVSRCALLFQTRILHPELCLLAAMQATVVSNSLAAPVIVRGL